MDTNSEDSVIVVDEVIVPIVVVVVVVAIIELSIMPPWTLLMGV